MGIFSIACAAWKHCVFLVVVKLKLKVFVLLRKISANGQWKCYGWRFILRHSRIFYLAVNCSGGGLLWFSYLGELDFGHYDTGVTLAAGFLALILAPEFFQPLRDLGTFYHAKARAVGAADSLKTFMETPLAHPQRGEAELASTDPVTIEAEDLFITSPEGKTLAGPLNFTLPAGQRAVLVGRSGSGKAHC